MRRRNARRGLTLIEVMVALSLVAIATLALVAANTYASQMASRSYRHHVAKRLAQQRLDLLLLGETKQKLRTTALGKLVPDGTALDCQETGMPQVLCDGSAPDLVGWVDIYGRPCKREGTAAEGYHPTCQYRRYLRYRKDADTGASGDTWYVSVAVSHATDGECDNTEEGDVQCVVTSALLTR